MKEKVKGIAQLSTIIAVSLAIFGWFGIAINRASDKADAAVSQVNEVKGDLKAIQESINSVKDDFKWLRGELGKSKVMQIIASSTQ